MAYDERLADRVRARLRHRKHVEERRMFGGVAFLLHGHMACGIQEDRLVLRLGKRGAAAALRLRHTRPMDFTGKALTSMIYVEPNGWRQDAELSSWLNKALRFVRCLTPK